jgi:hypothetical protein
VTGGGWLIEMTTSPCLPGGEPTYSSIVIPMHAIEQDATDAYLDALLALHLRCLGFN